VIYYRVDDQLIDGWNEAKLPKQEKLKYDVIQKIYSSRWLLFSIYNRAGTKKVMKKVTFLLYYFD